MAVRDSPLAQPAEAGDTQFIQAPLLDDICRLVQGSVSGTVCSVLARVDNGPLLIGAPDLALHTQNLFQLPTTVEEALSRLQAHLAERFGFESCNSWPITTARGESLGTISLHYQDRRLEKPADTEVLRLASRLAALSIAQHAQRFGSHLDSITGLLNRSGLVTELDALVNAPEPAALAVVRIDLDGFHHINDALGGDAGDRLLGAAGRRLARLLAGRDLGARLGADEFVVVFTEQVDEHGLLHTARNLLEVLSEAYPVDNRELFLTVSIGVAMFPRHGDRSWELLRSASLAMREVKRRGGNGIEVFQKASSDRAVDRLEMESSLRQALETGELDLLYQPVFNSNGQVESFEALLTWRHPIRGPISPRQFIPIAEESGLIERIGSWVLQQVCITGARWRQAGLGGPRISLNVSARQFDQDNFVDAVATALALSGLPPQSLELELTESCVVQDLAQSAARMAQIRALGPTIAIDDFGTGYSSLSYLHKLPVDCIKIDQSFLRGIAEVDGSLPVIQGIVRLARSLKLTVVAEGVETIEELELIRLVGCDKAQGHLYGPPLRADEVQALLARSLPAVAK